MKPIWKAALINFPIFLIFFILFHPIYDSIEDVHVLYMLAGGFGSAPTSMLHYDQGLHPFFNMIIQNLFQLTGKVNWYSLSLLLTHYIFCTIVLEHIISQKRKVAAFVAYAVLFIVFEGYFMLYPDFTSASIILSASALFILLTRAWKDSLKPRHYILAGLLFLLGSFYRLETMIVVPGIALPFLALTVPNKTTWRLLTTLFISAVIVVAFNKIQRAYYTSQKADWPQEEAYRQSLFRFFNEGALLKTPGTGEKWYPEHQLITQGIIMDTSFMPVSKLDSMYADMKNSTAIQKHFSPEWKKWFYINNRLFFCTVIVFIVLYGWRKKMLPALVISLAMLATAFGYLLFNAKAPTYVLISPLSFICFTIFLYDRERFMDQQKMYKIAALAALILLIGWGTVRLYRTSNQNKEGTALFKTGYAVVASHPNTLFIGVKDFYLHKFYAFDIPANYKLSNYLVSESFINGNYQSTFQRFGIHTIKDMIASPHVLFYGEPGDGLKKHLEEIAGRPVVFLQVSEFKKGNVWKIE